MSLDSDRRKNKRYYFKALLQVADTSEYSNVELESINISAGGIFFRSSQMLELDKKLSLLFSLPEIENPVEAQCIVMHNLETIPGKQYFIGVKFTSLDGITTKELEEVLTKHFD